MCVAPTCFSCVLVCVRTKETKRSSWRCRPSLLLSVTWSSLCLWAPPFLPGARTAVAGCQAAGAEATSSVRAVISRPPGCSNATPASQLSNVPTFCAKSRIQTANSHLTSAHQLSIWQPLYSTIISVPNDLNLITVWDDAVRFSVFFYIKKPWPQISS